MERAEDVDYSGTINSADSNLVLQSLSDLVELSSLQKKLADADQDGDVDIIDVIAINNMFGNTASLDEILHDFYDAQVQAGGMNMSYSAFAGLVSHTEEVLS